MGNKYFNPLILYRQSWGELEEVGYTHQFYHRADGDGQPFTGSLGSQINWT